jgi:hypothetical protein
LTRIGCCVGQEPRSPGCPASQVTSRTSPTDICRIKTPSRPPRSSRTSPPTTLSRQ